MSTPRFALSIALALATASMSLAAPPERSLVRLQAMLKKLDALPIDAPDVASLRDQVDAEAGQRYAWASRLFWYTDLEQAKAAAAKSGKPILSLRLLGKLTDELSCANSRYFRTVLYANSKISQQLRNQFVLHWSSERPVPVLTVDFGDGRVMKRTVTGNSIHYLLDESGQPLDAMPGLVSPQVFSQWLTSGVREARFAKANIGKSHGELLQLVQSRLQREQANRWQDDLNKVRAVDPKLVAWTAANNPARFKQAIEAQLAKLENSVAAETAVAIATPKRATEAILIPQLTMANKSIPETVENNTEFWRALAAVYLPQVVLDDASLALIAYQRPHAYQHGEAAVEAMLLEFRKNLAMDTARNQYLLQRKLRKWLSEKPMDLATLNQRVYSELFLTPRQDPYLGLLPSNAYSGLESSGLLDAKSSSAAPNGEVSTLQSSAGG